MYIKNEFAGKTSIVSSESSYGIGQYLNSCDCLPGCFGIVMSDPEEVSVGKFQYAVNWFYRKEENQRSLNHKQKRSSSRPSKASNVRRILDSDILSNIEAQDAENQGG